MRLRQGSSSNLLVGGVFLEELYDLVDDLRQSDQHRRLLRGTVVSLSPCISQRPPAPWSATQGYLLQDAVHMFSEFARVGEAAYF